ncbi:hypothetical protein ACLKA7_001276 [Drosophila subpalustris]
MSGAHYLAVQRAIAANPRAGPKPLTIEEYRARQPVQANRNNKDPKTTWRSVSQAAPRASSSYGKSKRRSTSDMGRSVSPMA